MILDDVLLPGDRIRQEAIAKEFGVSRLPVREALRMLEAEGLSELRANSGARVSRMSMAELETGYKIRERIEPLALVESMPRLTDADVERLEQTQREIEDSDRDLVRFLGLDRELHKLTYRGCPVPQLSDMVDRFWNTTQHYRRAFVRLSASRDIWIINAEHGLLIEAIRKRDAVEAEHVLAGHIRRTRVQLA